MGAIWLIILFASTPTAFLVPSPRLHISLSASTSASNGGASPEKNSFTPSPTREMTPEEIRDVDEVTDWKRTVKIVPFSDLSLHPPPLSRLVQLTKEITWLSGRNMHNKALRKYKSIRALGSYPSSLEGFSAVLQSCAKAKIGAVADKIVFDMVTSSKANGWDIPTKNFRIALAACASSSRPTEALAIIDAMIEEGVGGDAECFSLAMESCIKAPNSAPVEELARGIMRRVRDCQATADKNQATAATATAMAAAASSSASDYEDNYDDDAYYTGAGGGGSGGSESAAPVSLITRSYYGHLLQVLVRSRRFSEAVACFNLLQSKTTNTDNGYGYGGDDDDEKPLPEHYLAAMKAAVATKDGPLVKSLLGEVLMDEGRFRETLNPILELAAKFCANANSWRLAVKLLDKTSSPRSYGAHHAVIASTGRALEVKLTLELMDRLKNEGYTPSRATYNAVLHACSASGEVAAARAVLEEMTAAGITLNVVTYNIALNSRAKQGDARGAIDLLSEMEAAGIEPTVVSFATAINAAAQYNSSALAATLMESMAPLGVEPNAYVFTAALHACENDPNDTEASSAAMKIVDAVARVESSHKTLPVGLVTRMAAQAKRIMGRDLSARNLAHLVSDEKALGVVLKGRQEAV